MKKIILNILFTIYVVIAVFVTICLLSYNQFKVTEFGNNTWLIVRDNTMEPQLKKGSLAIINKKDLIEVGDNALYYKISGGKINIKLNKVVNKEEITETETTYTFEGQQKVSSDYVIGTTKTAKTIPNLGNILGIVESKYGFLFLIVLPTLVAFLYQIAVVVSSLKKTK